MTDYGLDLHCSMILEEYRECYGVFDRMKDIVLGAVREKLRENNLLVTALEGRVKTEASLAGKLELKGAKYRTLSDITDILGVRVITFYTDDVDKIAALAGNLFDIDWNESVDKRRMHELDSFGYNSLHYICRIPASLYSDPEHPEINELRFELQMRTTLQHMWANMYHDTGYKSGVEIPVEHLRNLNRLAGMLELADDEFSRIRTAINEYRRQVQSLVSGGRFDEVRLNGDTFRSYLKLRPFDKLNYAIAAINQAEVHETSLMPYLPVLKGMGMETLGDVQRLLKECGRAAYQLAVHQIGGTDLDIISSSVALQDLCIVRILGDGGGVRELEKFFESLSGPSSYNADRAKRVFEQASQLEFMNKNGK